MHEGHRGRLLSKVVAGDKLYEHEYLEALLFAACPRRDVNGVAHSLIDRFGSLEGVLQADEAQLVSVRGVGVNIARYLMVLGKCLCGGSSCTSFACIKSTAQFRAFLTARAGVACGLELHMLDADGRVKRIARVADGISPFPSRKVVRAITAYRPYGVFAAHVVVGRAAPSREDDFAARELEDICNLGGVRLYDYCIAGEDGIFSYFVEDRVIGKPGGER